MATHSNVSINNIGSVWRYTFLSGKKRENSLGSILCSSPFLLLMALFINKFIRIIQSGSVNWLESLIPSRFWLVISTRFPSRHQQVDFSTTVWFIDYLKNTPQFVWLKDCVSERVVSRTGAPQGTGLSPSLFTQYNSRFQYNLESCHLKTDKRLRSGNWSATLW